MSEPEYVAIEVAGRLTGVPARTLRRWAEAGKVPVVAGQRGRLVRPDDVRRLAVMTGHQPDADDVSGAFAGQGTGHMAEGVAADNMPPSPGAVSPAARSQLEAIRDEWLQPLIDQLREAERTIGRVEAERDHAIRELGAVRAELPALKVPSDASQDANAAPVRGDVAETTQEPWRPASEPQEPGWRRLWRRVRGRG